MISQLERTTQDQTAHSDFAESLKRHVIEQTDNGRRIIESVTSIMEGDAPNCTPWHQLEAAKLLHKLGLGNTPTNNLKPPLPAGEGWGEGTQNIPSPLMEEGQDGGEESSPSLSDEQTKFNNKLIRQIRVHTGDGASIVKNLIEIMEGEDPTTKGRDRLDAIRMLLSIPLNSPVIPQTPSSCCKLRPLPPRLLLRLRGPPRRPPAGSEDAHPAH